MTYRQMVIERRNEQRQLDIAEQVMARVGPHPNNPAFQGNYDDALSRAIESRNSVADMDAAIVAEEDAVA